MIKFVLKHSKYLSIVIVFTSILRGGILPLNIFMLERIIYTAVNRSNFQLKNTLYYILIFLAIQIAGSIEYKFFEEKETYSMIDRLVTKSKGNLIDIVSSLVITTISISGIF